MEHISEFEILELIADRLGEERKTAAERHISSCAECSRRHADALRTWEMLGEWQPENAGIDISEAIVARAREINSALDSRLLAILSSRRLLSVAVRVAASIIIAVSIGAMSGTYSARSTLAMDSPELEAPDYLAALGLQWSSDLNWSVLEEHQPDREVEE